MKAKAATWSPEELAIRTIAISNWWLGKERGPQTLDQKQATSIRSKEWHANNIHPMSGKQHSEESKIKISKANKGRVISKESIKRSTQSRMMDTKRENSIVQAYKDGKVISKIEKEFNTSRGSIYRVLKRNNILKDSSRNSGSNTQHSRETKEKMSKARRKYWHSKLKS